MREGGQKVFVQWIAVTVDALFFVHLGPKSEALFGGVGQLAKAIGQFNPACVHFEPFCATRIIRAGAGEGRFGHGVAIKHGDAGMAEVGFNAFRKDARQHVGPCVIRGVADVLSRHLRGQGRRIGFAVWLDGGQKINARMAGKGLGNREPFKGQRGVTFMGFVTQFAAACRLGGQVQKSGAIIHKGVVILPDAVPFQHGEFRAVQRSAFAVAPDMGESVDARLTRYQQFFHRKFGRGVQIHCLSRAIIADG